MKLADARLLVDELESLIGENPGQSEWKLNRCQEIIDEVMWGQSDAYLSEKASTAREFLGYWFSPRKWQKWGPAEHMHHLVLMDVKKFEGALEQHFRER
jgi:hypothetical protein